MLPVTKLDRSLARNSAAFATSSGVPILPRGTRFAMYFISSFLKAPVSIFVLIGPGAMQFTRIPSRAWSSAIARVKLTTPPLLAQYAAYPCPPLRPHSLAMLIIAAFAVFRRWGTQCFEQRYVPLRFVSRTVSQVFSDVVSTVPPSIIPALFTSMSIRLNFLSVCATIFLTDESEVTSVLTKSALAPVFVISCSTFLPSGLLAAMTTLAPSFANSSAIAFPIPELAPVTIATFFFSCISSRIDCENKRVTHVQVPVCKSSACFEVRRAILRIVLR